MAEYWCDRCNEPNQHGVVGGMCDRCLAWADGLQTGTRVSYAHGKGRAVGVYAFRYNVTSAAITTTAGRLVIRSLRSVRTAGGDLW